MQQETQFQKISELMTAESAHVMTEMLAALDDVALPGASAGDDFTPPDETTQTQSARIVEDLFDHCRGNPNKEGNFYKGYSFFQSGFYQSIAKSVDQNTIPSKVQRVIDQGKLPKGIIYDAFDVLKEAIVEFETRETNTYPDNKIPSGAAPETVQTLNTLAHLNHVAAALFKRGMDVPQILDEDNENHNYMTEKSRYMAASQILRERVNELVIELLPDSLEEKLIAYEHLSMSFLQEIQEECPQHVASAKHNMFNRVETRQAPKHSKSKARMGYVGLGYGITDSATAPESIPEKVKQVAAIAENMNVHTYGMNHGVYNAGKSHNMDGSKANMFALDAMMLREATNLHLLNLTRKKPPILDNKEALDVLHAFASTNRELAEGQNLECCVHPKNDSILLDYYRPAPDIVELLAWKQDRDISFAGSLFGAAFKAGMAIDGEELTEAEKTAMYDAVYHFTQNYQKANDASDQLIVAENAKTVGKKAHDQNFDVREHLFTENIIALWCTGLQEVRDFLSGYTGTPEDEKQFQDYLENYGANSLYWLTIKKVGDEAKEKLHAVKDGNASGEAERIMNILTEEFDHFLGNNKLQQIAEKYPSSTRFKDITFEEFISPQFENERKREAETDIKSGMHTHQPFINNLRPLLHPQADVVHVANNLRDFVDKKRGKWQEELKDVEKRLTWDYDAKKIQELKRKQVALLEKLASTEQDAINGLDQNAIIELIERYEIKKTSNPYPYTMHPFSFKSQMSLILAGRYDLDRISEFVHRAYGEGVEENLMHINLVLSVNMHKPKTLVPYDLTRAKPGDIGIFKDLFRGSDERDFFKGFEDATFIRKLLEPESPLVPLRQEIREESLKKLVSELRSKLRLERSFHESYEFPPLERGKATDWRRGVPELRDQNNNPLRKFILVHGDGKEASQNLAENLAQEKGYKVVYFEGNNALSSKDKFRLEKAGIITQADFSAIAKPLKKGNNLKGFDCIIHIPSVPRKDKPLNRALKKHQYKNKLYQFTLNLDEHLPQSEVQKLANINGSDAIEIKHHSVRDKSHPGGKYSQLIVTVPEIKATGPSEAVSIQERIIAELESPSDQNDEVQSHWEIAKKHLLKIAHLTRKVNIYDGTQVVRVDEKDLYPSLKKIKLPELTTTSGDDSVTLSASVISEKKIAYSEKPFMITEEGNYRTSASLYIYPGETNQEELANAVVQTLETGKLEEQYVFSPSKHLDKSRMPKINDPQAPIREA